MGAAPGAIGRRVPPSFTRGLKAILQGYGRKFSDGMRVVCKALNCLRFTLDCSMMRPVGCSREERRKNLFALRARRVSRGVRRKLDPMVNFELGLSCSL